MRANILADFFNFLGDALERFNPAAFRFLSASLPYLTPVPVAWLTAHSTSEFLNFTPTVSFIFVFALEGIGLWFTTLLVDAIVEWVRSRNIRSFVPVILFTITVGVYIYLLVNLNVTLEQASGNPDPVLSRVITLMCFLPLITGVGNGYYKLKLDYKTQAEIDRQRNDEKEREIRQEKSAERLEKLRIKAGNLLESQKVSSNLPESYQNGEKVSSNFPTDWRKVRPSLTTEEVTFIATHEPKEIVEKLASANVHISPRTASNWRTYAQKEKGISS